MVEMNYFGSYSFDMIRKVISNARKAPFWRERITSPRVGSLNEFRRLPITTREEINRMCDCGRWNELLTVPPRDDHIILTSGGRPYRSPFQTCVSKTEFDQMSWPILDMFSRNEIQGGRILIVFPGVMPYPSDLASQIWPDSDIEEYQSQHISGALMKYASIRHGLRTFCSGLRFLAYKVSEDEAVIERRRIMDAYSIVRPDILATSPNILRNVFFPEIRKRKRTFRDFDTKIVISGGSKLAKEDCEALSRLGNPEVVVWIESGEIGTIGYSKSASASLCRHLYYYTSWRQNFFETVDDIGDALPFGEWGRIVVTRLNTLTQPLIRYSLEDEGRFRVVENELILGQDIKKL